MGSNRWMRNSFVYLLVIVGIIVIFYTLLPSFGGTNEEPLTTVIAMAKANEIRQIEVDGKKLTVYPKVVGRGGADRFVSRIGEDTDVVGLLVDSGVEVGPPSGVGVTFKGSSGFSSFFGLMLNFLPLIFFGGLILFMMRQAQGSNNQTLSFGRSRAKLMTFNRPGVTFNDVAGVDEAKAELKDLRRSREHKQLVGKEEHEAKARLLYLDAALHRSNGKLKRTEAVLHKLVERYPGTRAAKQATEELKKLPPEPT